MRDASRPARVAENSCGPVVSNRRGLNSCGVSPSSSSSSLTCVLASDASASQLIDRNATGVKLAVNAKGEALITYSARRQAEARARLGRDQRDRADARPRAGEPSSSTTRVAGASTSATTGRRSARPAAPTTARRSPGMVAACKAPDGSYWALQAWQRMLAELRRGAERRAVVWELRLSHWTGDAAGARRSSTDWAWHQWDHLFGTFTLRRQPGLRLQVDDGRQPARHVRPQHLRRHLRLGVRHRLEAREQLPRRTPAPVPSATASTRTGRIRPARAAVPRDGRWPRRHA